MHVDTQILYSTKVIFLLRYVSSITATWITAFHKSLDLAEFSKSVNEFIIHKNNENSSLLFVPFLSSRTIPECSPRVPWSSRWFQNKSNTPWGTRIRSMDCIQPPFTQLTFMKWPSNEDINIWLSHGLRSRSILHCRLGCGKCYPWHLQLLLPRGFRIRRFLDHCRLTQVHWL